MAYPTTLITDTTPGVDIYPPQSGQAFGSYSGAPVGTANPDHPTWMKRTSDEIVSIETALGLPSNPAVGSMLYQINQDYGDYAAPASPSAYNDEFTSGTLNTTQWTPSGTGTGATIQNVAPSYCQMQVIQGASTAVTTLKLTETIVSTTTFVWQTKVRFMFSPVAIVAAGSTYAEVAFVLKNTTASKAIGIFLIAQAFFSSPNSYFYPITLGVNRGNTLATANTNCMLASTGLDIRLRIGLVGGTSGNLVASVSLDGYNWMQIWSESYTSGNSLTNNLPNQLYLQMDNTGSTAGNIAGGAMLSAWDYVRMMA